MLNLNLPLGLCLQYFFTFLAFLHELKNTRSCLVDLVLLRGRPCARGSIPCAQPVTAGRDKGRELPWGCSATRRGQRSLALTALVFPGHASPLFTRPVAVDPVGWSLAAFPRGRAQIRIKASGR